MIRAVNRIWDILYVIVIILFIFLGITEIIQAITIHPIEKSEWVFYHAFTGVACLLWLGTQSDQKKIKRLEKELEEYRRYH